MEALYYDRLDNDRVQCKLCPMDCMIMPGETGLCKARINQGGILVARSYGEVTGLTTETLADIPIRYHQMSTQTKVLSVGGYGCNMHCGYCRNAHFSQRRAYTETLGIDDVLLRLSNLHGLGVVGLCYTYNEPGIALEYICDLARHVHDCEFLNVLDSNAFLNPEPFAELIQDMDIINLDLKAFDDDSYVEHFEGFFEPVWQNIAYAAGTGKHLEISIVIVEGVNDDPDVFERAIKALHDIAPNAGVHLIPMEPHHLMKSQPRPMAVTMHALLKIAAEYYKDKVDIVHAKKVEYKEL